MRRGVSHASCVLVLCLIVEDVRANGAFNVGKLVSAFVPQSRRWSEPAVGSIMINRQVVGFPGTALVELENGIHMPLRHVSMGDRVRVSRDTFSKVCFFAQQRSKAVTQYVHLEAGNGAVSVTIAPVTLLHVAGGKLRAAGNVRIGDEVESAAGEFVKIDRVFIVHARGVFAPLTAAGDIIVDGVRTSCGHPYHHTHPYLTKYFGAPTRFLPNLRLVTNWLMELSRGPLSMLLCLPPGLVSINVEAEARLTEAWNSFIASSAEPAGSRQLPV